MRQIAAFGATGRWLSAIGRRLVPMVALATVSACAPAAPGTAGAPQAAAQPADAPLAWLLGDEVLVLPLQELELRGAAAAASPADDAGLRRSFDGGLQTALGSYVPEGRWVWPPALAALRTRNPTVMPDPYRLSIRGLRPNAAQDTQLSQDLGSQIRAILALSGARRYVLLPLRLTVTADAGGASRYETHLLVLDSRRAVVRQPFAHSGQAAGGISEAVAAAVAGAAAGFVTPEQ